MVGSQAVKEQCAIEETFTQWEEKNEKKVKEESFRSQGNILHMMYVS